MKTLDDWPRVKRVLEAALAAYPLLSRLRAGAAAILGGLSFEHLSYHFDTPR